jgi:AcrR family transcriptional regulator
MAARASAAKRPKASRQRRTRSDGERSRSTILGEAARLATVEGISGLSLGRLADSVGMSKSGLFAHFGSKEELQLATIETANEIFDRQVLAAASNATTGIERLRALTDAYLRYVESGTFPGGCFFASVLVEISMQPGPVRDRLVRFLEDWLGRLETAAREAQQEGDIANSEDPAQLAFDLESSLFLANSQFAVSQSHEPIERGRRAIERRLKEAAA